jgi:hypothetical protein
MAAKRMAAAVCLAVMLAGGLSVLAPTNWCAAASDSWFLSWYFGCAPDYPTP